MSRIGKKPILIPEGVDIKIENSHVRVKGTKGNLQWKLPPRIKLSIKDNSLMVERIGDSKNERALHGLARSLVNNMVTGVSDGFRKDLEIIGVGYRAQATGNKIEFFLGYSKPVEFTLPEGINVDIDKKQVKITIEGIDKQLIGQVAANMRALRPPDAYKGKGIRYADEIVRLKPGKAGTK